MSVYERAKLMRMSTGVAILLWLVANAVAVGLS